MMIINHTEKSNILTITPREIREISADISLQPKDIYCTVLDFASKVEGLRKKKCLSCKERIPFVCYICPLCKADLVQIAKDLRIKKNALNKKKREAEREKQRQYILRMIEKEKQRALREKRKEEAEKERYRIMKEKYQKKWKAKWDRYKEKEKKIEELLQKKREKRWKRISVHKS
jgi:hypothetical protein